MNSVLQDVLRCRVGEVAVSGVARTAAFVFPADFAGFGGHFPGSPVVPGIAQVYAAQVAAGAVPGEPGGPALLEVKRCKFMRPVLPDETMLVTLTGETDNGFFRCKAEITANGESCASLSLVFSGCGAA